MALISDADFLIHSLRLAYLREVEDPYGPRVISLDPSYHTNPYILAASLADVDRWPELAMPSSPQVSDNEQENSSGFPGSKLKYTQTIMGGKTGGLGLRVTGKKESNSKRHSISARPDEVKNFVTGNAPVQEAAKSPVAVPNSVISAPNAQAESWIKVEDLDGDNHKPSPRPDVQVQSPTVAEEAPVAKVVQFIPKFKGAAEMEARRRRRMAARRGPNVHPLPPASSPSLDFSSDEDVPIVNDSSSSDEFDHDVTGGDSSDDGDEFDSEFVAPRNGLSDSTSDLISVISGGTNSISNFSGPFSPSHPSTRSRQRPGPIPGRISKRQKSIDRPIGSFFHMVTPSPNGKLGEDSFQLHKQDINIAHRRSSVIATHNPTSPLISSSAPEPLFLRKKVVSTKPQHSALSAMLASSGRSSNPFAEMYAAISGRGEAASTTVQVFFPHTREPTGKAMDINVRRDATVEEVIGFSLWNYWEEGWLPKLDDGLSGEDDLRWETRLSAVGWILRIAEEDGEVDDDFPPPDRIGKISKFNADAYAVLEATATQIQQNQVLESKIQRRPSRTTIAKKSDKLTVPVPSSTIGGPGSAVFGSTLASMPLSTSLGPSSSHGPQIFLRIRVADTADAVHISTTIPVSAGMYMQEALEMVCRKRKLQNPNDYALLLAAMDNLILIPLDRTVASLQGKRELLLVKRSMLPQMGVDIVRGIGRSTDPNASIFKHISDTPEQQYSSAWDYTSAYKKYTVYRKMTMLVARQERTLAIDGVYLHIMPTNKAKAVFDSAKTSSFHIKSISDCQQSAKTSSTFKIVFNRGSKCKRYDYEADSPKLAAEIVQTIKGLKAALERSGTINKSRRSRQVV